MTDLETAVKNSATLFNAEVTKYNNLKKNDKAKAEYPVPMALNDNGQYVLVSVIKKEYQNPRKDQDKNNRVQDDADNACIENLLKQFIENKNKSQRIVIVANIKNLQRPYTNEKHKIDGGRLWLQEDGSYLYVSTCATTLKDIIAGENGIVAKVSDL